ncbi:MAG: class I SAM-dependent methyltransferase [Gaiellaceae bacterium]
MTPGRDEHSRYFVTTSMPPLLRAVAEAAPPPVLADLGAGEGAILYALDRAGLVGERIYAVDLSRGPLAAAERLSPKVKAILSDVAHVPEIADGSVDAVTSSQVIEHVHDEGAFVAEIARILRPGGWFYVSSVLRGRRAWWFRRGGLGWQIDPTHLREYPSEAAFSEALRHDDLELDRVQSRPLRFPVADAALRVATGARLVPAAAVSTIYARSLILSRLRAILQVRVPGYRWVEAAGRRR